MLHRLNNKLVVVGHVENGATGAGVAQFSQDFVAEGHEVVARGNAEQVTEVAEGGWSVNLKPARTDGKVSQRHTESGQQWVVWSKYATCRTDGRVSQRHTKAVDSSGLCAVNRRPAQQTERFHKGTQAVGRTGFVQ